MSPLNWDQKNPSSATLKEFLLCPWFKSLSKHFRHVHNPELKTGCVSTGFSIVFGAYDLFMLQTSNPHRFQEFKTHLQ